MGSIRKGTAKQVYHEWQKDSLAAPNVNNAALEGDVFSATARSQPTRLGNYCQISREDLEVSGTVQAVVLAGRANEFAYEVSKASREIKRDMETILLSNQSPSAGAGFPTQAPRKLRPVIGWLTTNVITATVGGPYAAGTGTAGRADAIVGNRLPFTEANLKLLQQAVYTQGGEADLLLMAPFNRSAFSNIAGPIGTQKWVDAEKKVLNASIDVYSGDFGDITVKADRFMRPTDALLLDTELWALCTLRDFKVEDLAKVGDSERGLMTVEYTLEASNEAGSGGLFDLTTV